MFRTDLRRVADLDTRVLDAVKKRTPSAMNVQITQVQEKFLDGLLYSLTFETLNTDGEVTGSYVNRVYVTKNSIEAYGHDEFLFQIVGARHSKSFYDVFANGDVVSGIIALVVTILIVPSFWISYFTPHVVEAPAWITSGWLLILGFYFGKASGKSDS